MKGAAILRVAQRSFHYAFPLSLLFAIVMLRVAVPFVQELQLKVFDAFQRIAPRTYEPVPVRLLDIDDDSLERVGQWPWPRTVVAQMVAELANRGAAVIVFDAVFAEPDRTSPANILPTWPSTPEIEALKSRSDTLPDHDAILGEVIGQAGNVVTGFVLTGGKAPRRPAVKGSFAFAGDDPKQFVAYYTGSVVNLPQIEAASAGNGSFNMVPETDGVIRRVPLFVRLDDQLYPTLGIEALRVAQQARTFIIKASGASGEIAYGERTGLNNVKVGRIEVPTDGEGRLWIHDTGRVPARYVPAWKLFDPAFTGTEEIEGNIVVIGTSAAGLQDLRTTPLAPVIPGAEVHVQALEQMLLGHYIGRPDWSNGAEIVFMIGLGGLLAILIPALGAVWTALIGGLGIAVAVGTSWYLYTAERLLIDPVLPSIAVLVTFMASALLNYLRTEAEKQQVRGAFSRYLSPALVEQLADEPDRLVLGGEMRDMTLMFSDIRGFTAISEQFKSDPRGLTKLINSFLTPMTNIILAQRGTIDKYMGDAIMAFWNAPLEDADHAAHACDAALTMVAELQRVNDDIKARSAAEGRPFFPINIGIGLNSGEVCVGNMGSDQRFDYSVLGDAVNLASRLEGQSKNYGVYIVIGEETYKRAPDYAVLELDLIAVKGKKEAVRIFCVLGDRTRRLGKEFQAHEAEHKKMLDAYRGQRWVEARELLERCRKFTNELAGLYDLYEARLDQYELEPPDQQWDGVFVATSK